MKHPLIISSLGKAKRKRRLIIVKQRSMGRTTMVRAVEQWRKTFQR